MKKNEMIGFDRTCKPVYVGDTIQDAEGKKYTITPLAKCKGQDGKEVDFSSLHGPELCTDEQKPVAVADPKPEVKLLPKRKGGKENKTGLISLNNLARRLQVKQAGIARTLRAGGIEVVKGKNGYGIRVSDVEKAEQLLAPLKVALPEMKKIGLGDVLDASKQPEGPAVDFEALCEQAKTPSELERLCVEQLEQLGHAPRNLEVKILPSLTTATDQQLAEELRRRGFEVTATKTVVVSL